MKCPPRLLPVFVLTVAFGAALLLAPPPARGFPVIVNIVESGGDNEATDTVPAKWTGVTFPVTQANEPVNGLAVGANYTVTTFGNYVPCYVDRNHRYTNAAGVAMPPYLIGQEYIMIGNDNRDNATLTLDVTVGTAVRVYLLIDNRMGPATEPTANANNPPTFGAGAMQWVVDDGWLPVLNGINRTANATLPDEVAVDEAADNTINNWFSIYSKTFPAGTFQLKQGDNTGRNMYGVVVQSISPPATPTGLTAVGADTKVTLNWNAAGGAASYWVKRSLTSGGPYDPVANVTSPTYMDTAVVNGTPYYYVVSGTNASGESANSAEATATPNVAPVNVVAVGGTNQVTVSWDPLAGAASYTVKRSSTNGGPYTAVGSGILGTSHVDPTVASGRTYFYVVIAQMSGGGDSGQSTEAAGTTAPGAPTVSVTLFAATVLRVGWTIADPVVTQFHVEQSTDGMNFIPLATVPATQRVTNSGLALNTTYHYRVQAENGSGFSPYSAVASGTTPVSGLNINFANGPTGQPANDPAPTPPGYLQDIGDLFDDRGNGYSYGWNRSIAPDGRWRKSNNAPDLRYDTFNHMIKAVPPAVWEIGIPNGFYSVRVVGGDPGNVDSVFQYELEGALTGTYIPTAVNNGNWADFTLEVGISDGRLTVRSGPNSQTTANNNKICFLDIYPAIPVPPVIGTHPQSQMVEEYHAASFSVTVASGSPTFAYQWYLNDAPISGANAATYTIPHAVNGTHTGNYFVVVTNYGGSVTSTVATLTTFPDVTAPVLISAGSLDGISIGLCFSEAMDDSFGVFSDASSYRVFTTDGEQPVGTVSPRPGNRELRVYLSLPSAGAFWVEASGLTDLAGNPCTANRATNTFGGFTTGDVGSPMFAGSHFTCDNSAIEIVGGGADVWTAADQAHLATRSMTGDFDARVRVTSLAGQDAATKAVLVARETINADSAGFHISINPPPPGRNQIELGVRTNTASLTGPWVANGNNSTNAPIPNCWMRITRVGNVFTGFRSTNGTDWIAMGTNNRPFSATLEVGIGVTAHNNNLLATGTFNGLKISSLVGVDIFNEMYSGGTFTGSFATEAGFTYTAEYKNTVNPGAWTSLGTFTGDGTVKTFTDPGPVSPTSHRVYRVRYQ